MKITELRKEGDSGQRAVARVVWEDCDRPPIELYYETEPEFGSDLAASPEACLLAGALPAVRGGEQRVLVEGSLCPRLRDGILIALDRLSHWYGRPPASLEIEATDGFRPLCPRAPARAGLFLTGGVDSSHLLDTNRRRFPDEHPSRFRDGLAVFGLVAPGQERTLRALDHAGRTRRALAGPADEAGVKVVPVYTNLLQLAPDIRFLGGEFLSAALASTAHAFARRISSVSIAAGWNIELLRPCGSHPLLDPGYSSSALSVRHEEVRIGRLQKLSNLMGWQTAVRGLIVCGNHPAAPDLNCGRCEKCLRTMTEILSLEGSLGGAPFPVQDVRAEDLREISIGPGIDAYWRELLPRLASRGRADLVSVLHPKLRLARFRRWDEKFLRGTLLKTYRRARR